MEEVATTGVPIVANELAYNLLSRAIEESILPYCIQRNIGVIGYMPMQQGLLSGKYSSLNDIRPMQARSRHFHKSWGSGTRHGEEGAEEEISLALQTIRDIADELGVPVTVLSLAWVIAQPGITTTIAGSRNVQQLETNFQATRLRLNGEVLAR